MWPSQAHLGLEMTAETGLQRLCVSALHHITTESTLKRNFTECQLDFLWSLNQNGLYAGRCVQSRFRRLPGLLQTSCPCPSLDPDWVVMELISLKLWGCLGGLRVPDSHPILTCGPFSEGFEWCPPRHRLTFKRVGVTMILTWRTLQWSNRRQLFSWN